MPNWDSFWYDSAYFVNWTLYVLCITLLCAVIPALAAWIVIAIVTITKQISATITTKRREIKMLEKMYHE